MKVSTDNGDFNCRSWRAIFGGNNYLDGYSVYDSPRGYKHLVTFGMTELYADEEKLGGEWNGWGYEMTIKLAEQTAEDCKWAIDMLSNLALITIPDTEAQTLDSIYGRTEFIQLVGITEREFQAIRENGDNIQLLYDRMKKESPDFVTDMGRKKSYL